MLRSAILGFLSGVLFDIIVWFCGPLDDNSWFSNFVLWISTPAAYMVSWFTGDPMQQEAAIFHYIIGVLVTFPVLGLMIGITCSILKNYRRRSIPAA